MIMSTKGGICIIEGDEHDQKHKGGRGLNIRGNDKHDKNTQKGNGYDQ
jgi:hypothetical protein